MRTRLALLVAALAALAASAADVRTVALAVIDDQGRFVPDLRAEEVAVFANGEPLEVRSFEKDERPLFVTLVLDSSDGALRDFRVPALDAVPAFVAALPSGSTCSLWTTGDRPRKVGLLEGDSAAIEKRVARGFGAGGTNALLDTLVEASEALARESGRRRALVAVSGLSSGHTSRAPGDVSGPVRRAGARVFAAMYHEGEGLGAGPLAGMPRDTVNLTIVGRADHERMLSSLAQATGGRFEAVGTASSVGRLLEAWAAELAGQYRVRFALDRSSGPTRIEARIGRPGVHWRVTVDSP
jgi:hypothetical protein